MYCTDCGHQNPEGSKFCENCGKPITGLETTLKPLVTTGKQTRWVKRLASIGGLIVILCFFLPWILVSCTYGQVNAGVKANGFDIATGSNSFIEQAHDQLSKQLSDIYDEGSIYNLENSMMQYYEMPSYPLLIAIPFLGAIGLISLNGRVSGSIAAIVSGVLGVVCMILFTVAASNKINETFIFGVAERGVKYNYELGYWGSWIGLVWLIIGGIFSWRQIKQLR